MGKQIVSAAPGAGGIDWSELKGKLFVVEPLELEKDINTQYGKSDAVRANVYVLLGRNKTEDYEDTLIFPKVLQSQTRRQIGSIVVGRLGQGEAKKGQDPPWTFEEANEKDLKRAGDFWTSKAISSASDDDEDEDDDQDDDDDAF